MQISNTDARITIADALFGQECWYASCGGSAGAAFELALGKKMARKYPIKNPAHSQEFRNFEGTTSLFVWCTWRLDDSEAPVTSSDDENSSVIAGLNQLVGHRISNMDIRTKGMDASITFSNGYTLSIFCDHVPGAPSFDGNWEVVTQASIVAIEVGSHVSIVKRV